MANYEVEFEVLVEPNKIELEKMINTYRNIDCECLKLYNRFDIPNSFNSELFRDQKELISRLVLILEEKIIEKIGSANFSRISSITRIV